MMDAEKRVAARQFAQDWAGRGDEKQDCQSFWLTLLQKVYGVEEPEKAIDFEVRVQLGHTSFIDGYIKDTRVLIEQKGIDIDLKKGYRQSDGSLLTPFGQARRYAGFLPHDMNPRWIIVSNFKEFHIHDMNRPNDTPEIVLLAELEKDFSRMNFLVNEDDTHIRKEMEVSIQAGSLVGKLYDAFLKQYVDPTNERSLKSLNMLCVRLVFCLYAEDAGIFGAHDMFQQYMKEAGVKNARRALIDLFRVLDTKVDERDPYMKEDNPALAAFPYVNGGLFSDENIEIPPFNQEIFDLLLSKASNDFDWREISPTIFGAVFESTLNPDTRRKGGMHYTSIENIHKVIDPLFMEDLRLEYAEIVAMPVLKTRIQRLRDLQDKLASLTFLDPACGSGNFLTETYLSLRKLENEIIRQLIDTQKGAAAGQIMMGLDGDFNPIKVSIAQFYGIEINDFAATVAKTALWIAESQMMKKTEDIIHLNLDFLPLKSYVNIVEKNALGVDWGEVVPREKLNYIMGNPPFVGFSLMDAKQKADMQLIFKDIKNLDYVAAWYKKASDFIQGTRIECGLVATNSIVQGETVARLWPLLNIRINYAHRTFIWDSEATQKAHVHCVIIGFACFDHKQKYIFQSGKRIEANNINAYLVDAPDVLVTSRSKPLCNIPAMVYGNKPADGGFLIIEDEEYEDFIKREPQAKKFIHPLLGATEFINNKKRWCLWLVGANPSELAKCPLVMERIKGCKETRANSIAAAIRRFADTPTLFAQVTQPVGVDYIIVPCHSSETRRYVPLGFMDANTIVTNAVQIIPSATVYDFGILTSNVHMAWMRAVCGRIKSDYRYSKDIVYNNFPWPTPTEAQKAKIEQTAQAILDARAKYPDCSLAELYNELVMPAELRTAHQKNDRAVMEAYGFWGKLNTESDCVAALMKMYQEMTK